ncbi:MAG: hypothetical protein M0Z42_15465 [Actinomycetota bacterium]|jgi:hypothetical protein|nr:hypothetical protein [Actinomycetota bacterium]
MGSAAGNTPQGSTAHREVMKTLRRRMEGLATMELSDRLLSTLARHHLGAGGNAASGTFYVDGHVRAYHGGREIQKTDAGLRSGVATRLLGHCILILRTAPQPHAPGNEAERHLGMSDKLNWA